MTLPGSDCVIARMSDFDISLDPARLQLDRVHAWLAGSYWSPDIRKDVVVRAFERSLVAGAYSGGVQLGVARIVTDEATFAWLCDVYVDEAARGRGIARAMVAALLAEPRLATIRRCCLATRDAHALYRGLGFVPVPAANWLELRGPAERWQDVPAVTRG